MLRITGLVFTLLYFTGYYLPFLLQGKLFLLSELSGFAAIAIFSILLAGGMASTSNIFRYFLRIAAAAFTTQIIIFLLSLGLNSCYYRNNILFTLLCAISLASGSGILTGSSYQVIAKLRPASGDAGKGNFNLQMQPLNYNFPPLLGIVFGLVIIIASIIITLKLDLDGGLLALFLPYTIFLANRSTHVESPDEIRQRRILRRSFCRNWLNYKRSVIYTTVLLVLHYFAGILFSFATPFWLFDHIVVLCTVSLVVFLPHTQKLANKMRIWCYAALPLIILFLGVTALLLLH